MTRASQHSWLVDGGFDIALDYCFLACLLVHNSCILAGASGRPAVWNASHVRAYVTAQAWTLHFARLLAAVQEVVKPL
ncbi:unnamed protein product [Protopolystoma xenopodis]|uniref:Uncharacterized protein n=1 Tax=Protopolystoma xenopodis TaxID=117903 RepID=A0A3S5B1B3_9PLAT|nr:unnamed protein product [Protopolystoma xenopodis]